MAYSSTICKDDPKKMAAIESAQSNDTLKMSMLDQSKASMIHISVLPCATGLLTMLESITEILHWQVAKNWHIVYFLTFFFFLSTSTGIARQRLKLFQQL